MPFSIFVVVDVVLFHPNESKPHLSGMMIEVPEVLSSKDFYRVC